MISLARRGHKLGSRTNAARDLSYLLCGSGAGSGSFGYFGKDGNNLSGGADGQQTGKNNSAVCGNNQSN